MTKHNTDTALPLSWYRNLTQLYLAELVLQRTVGHMAAGDTSSTSTECNNIVNTLLTDITTSLQRR